MIFVILTNLLFDCSKIRLNQETCFDKQETFEITNNQNVTLIIQIMLSSIRESDFSKEILKYLDLVESLV